MLVCKEVEAGGPGGERAYGAEVPVSDVSLFASHPLANSLLLTLLIFW